MNYLEACSFLESNKQYNHEKIKYLLGSEPRYIVTYDWGKSFYLCSKYIVKVVFETSTDGQGVSDFLTDKWEVVAIGRKTIDRINKYPSIKISTLFGPLFETKTGIEALQLRNSCKTKFDFWKNFWENYLMG